MPPLSAKIKYSACALMLLLVSPFVAAAATLPTITLPLTQTGNAQIKVGRALVLRVSGRPDDFQVAVTTTKKIRGCPDNLIYYAPHGPDPSDVMPWHVQTHYFPNVRTIPVCCFPLNVEVRLHHVRSAGKGPNARFTAGTLTATVLPRPAKRRKPKQTPPE